MRRRFKTWFDRCSCIDGKIGDSTKTLELFTLGHVGPEGARSTRAVRDASLASSVDLTVNTDASSGSNLASFVLVQPVAGWKAPLTEIEYLCFADLTSWPQAMRDGAQLPTGCGP